MKQHFDSWSNKGYHILYTVTVTLQLQVVVCSSAFIVSVVVADIVLQLQVVLVYLQHLHS